MRRSASIIIAVLAVALAPLPSSGVEEVILAGPGATLTTYTTPVLVFARGGTLTFLNLDIDVHDVVSDATRDPGTAPWCPAGGPRCPLFYSDQIGTALQSPVYGLHDIAVGVYPFACSPHAWMEGTLVVV